MRTDFKLDNRKVCLPNASTLSFGLLTAKRGNWMLDHTGTAGRVLGQVTCQRKVYIYAFVLSPEGDCILPRWIEPADVVFCLEKPPQEAVRLITMNWTNVDQILNDLQPCISDKLEKGNLT